MEKKINIQLASHDACTGCAACASVCPTGSITMREDKEGFLQPHIDAETCINCRKCEKTCPIVSPITIPTDFETQAYAAINKDEAIRMRSSSGGMFHALAKWTIEQGGVVFGARFNDQWEVVHDYTETLDGIEPFMRSKYVQSRIGDTFQQAKQFLEQGRWVLYSGTPCQIGGLKSYLHKDYDKLLTVDLICHGVPSPKVWRKYLKEFTNNECVKEFRFRDKTYGAGPGMNQYYASTSNQTYNESTKVNVYHQSFINGITVRRSCLHCEFRKYHRCSDYTIADYWGCEIYCPDMYDKKGVSIVFAHSEKASTLLHAMSNVDWKMQTREQATEYNPGMDSRNPKSDYAQRKLFFLSIAFLGVNKARLFSQVVPDVKSFWGRCKRKLIRIVKKS